MTFPWYNEWLLLMIPRDVPCHPCLMSLSRDILWPPFFAGRIGSRIEGDWREGKLAHGGGNGVDSQYNPESLVALRENRNESDLSKNPTNQQPQIQPTTSKMAPPPKKKELGSNIIWIIPSSLGSWPTSFPTSFFFFFFFFFSSSFRPGRHFYTRFFRIPPKKKSSIFFGVPDRVWCFQPMRGMWADDERSPNKIHRWMGGDPSKISCVCCYLVLVSPTYLLSSFKMRVLEEFSRLSK